MSIDQAITRIDVPSRQPSSASIIQKNQAQVTAQSWVNKKQKWHTQIAAIQRLSSCIQNHVVNHQLIDGYVAVLSFGNDLLQKEKKISTNLTQKYQKRIYYRWFDAYFQKLE